MKLKPYLMKDRISTNDIIAERPKTRLFGWRWRMNFQDVPDILIGTLETAETNWDTKQALTAPIFRWNDVNNTNVLGFAAVNWKILRLLRDYAEQLGQVSLPVTLIGFSLLAFSSSFNVSLSWSSLVLPMATIKSKKASRPALDPGELLWTWLWWEVMMWTILEIRRKSLKIDEFHTLSTWYPSDPPPGTSIDCDEPILDRRTADIDGAKIPFLLFWFE